MNFILTKNQYEVLSSLKSVKAFLSNSVSDEKNVSFVVEDISKFQDEIYFNIVEVGMNEEGAVNDRGKELFLIYDLLLNQI